MEERGVFTRMSTEISKQVALEIAHVLFIDIVGYSKLLIDGGVPQPCGARLSILYLGGGR